MPRFVLWMSGVALGVVVTLLVTEIRSGHADWWSWFRTIAVVLASTFAVIVATLRKPDRAAD